MDTLIKIKKGGRPEVPYRGDEAGVEGVGVVVIDFVIKLLCKL